ncbi:hypothetical protein [Paraburkholderia sp. BR14374]|uniref:hypothetical protein n=1 Tax=Paraburkholderia sp. BR14374 TaxID=3237007 RepID=UPI0034CF2566
MTREPVVAIEQLRMMKIGVECRSGSSRGWREATLATPFNALRKSGGARTEEIWNVVCSDVFVGGGTLRLRFGSLKCMDQFSVVDPIVDEHRCTADCYARSA